MDAQLRENRFLPPFLVNARTLPSADCLPCTVRLVFSARIQTEGGLVTVYISIFCLHASALETFVTFVNDTFLAVLFSLC